jgi:hypothetical protein
MQRSQELLDAYNQAIRDVMSGRITSVDDYLSDCADVSVIGTDPEEWWTDRATLVPIIERQFQSFRAMGASYRSNDAQAWTDGDLGYVIDHSTIALDDGRSIQMRATTILCKEGGRWKIVHQHTSIGVPNEQVEVFRRAEGATARV